MAIALPIPAVAPVINAIFLIRRILYLYIAKLANLRDKYSVWIDFDQLIRTPSSKSKVFYALLHNNIKIDRHK